MLAAEALLVIAHRLTTVQEADEIFVMKEGMVVQRGTHHELVNGPNGLYSELWAQINGNLARV